MSTSSSSTSTKKGSSSTWNDDTSVEVIVESTDWPPESQKEFVTFLKENAVFKLKSWTDLSEKDREDMKDPSKTKYPLPIPLVNLLNKAAGLHEVTSTTRMEIVVVPSSITSSLGSRLQGFEHLDFIKKLSSFKFIMDVLKNGLEHVGVKEGNYRLDDLSPFSKMFKTLPCFPGKPNQLDFKFLSGDLDDPNKTSLIVQRVLECIDKDSGVSDERDQPTRSTSLDRTFRPQALLGTSGCGKTKCEFDVLQQRFGIYLPFDTTAGIITRHDISGFLLRSLGKLAGEKYPKKNLSRDIDAQTQFEVECKDVVHILVLSWFLIFYIAYGSGLIKTPKDWFLLQINGGTNASWSSCVYKLASMIKNDHLLGPASDPYGLLQDCRSFFEIKFNTGFLLVLDEVNVLVKVLERNFLSLNQVQSSKESVVSPERPLSKLILSSLTEGLAFSFPLLFAGTNQSLREKDSLYSSVAKTRGEVIELQIRDEFVSMLSDEVERFAMTRIFLVKPDEEMCRIRDIFRGRIRFFLYYVSKLTDSKWVSRELLQKNKLATLNNALDQVVIELTESGENSIYNGIMKNLDGNFNSQSSALAEVIVCYYLNQGVLFASQDADYLKMNICLYKNTEKEYRVTEPLVIKTLMNIFRDKRQSFVEDVYLSYFTLAALQDPATFGVMFDKLVALALIEHKYSPQNYSKKLFDGFDTEATKDFPSWWKNRSDDCFQVDAIDIDVDLIEDIKNRWHITSNVVTASLPAKVVGMDLSVYDKGIHLAAGNKTSSSVKGVEKTEVNYNSQTSDFMKSYIGKKGDISPKNLEVLKLVSNLVKNKELIGRVIVEFVIPKASDDNVDWKPGIKLLKTQMSTSSSAGISSVGSSSSDNQQKEIVLETVLIRVDASNISKTGLFSNGICQQLLVGYTMTEIYGKCGCQKLDDAFCQSGKCSCQKNGKMCSEKCNCNGSCEPNPKKRKLK